jgi:GntR family transcriptional regulator
MNPVEDPRRYVRAMDFVRIRIEDGTFKPHELLPSIRELSDQTGHSRHTLGKAMRLLQDQGLVDRTPGLGYVAKGGAAATGGQPARVGAVNGHAGNSAWSRGGGTHDGR